MSKRLFYISGIANDPDIGSFIQEDLNNIKLILEPFVDTGDITLRSDEMVNSSLLLNRLSQADKVPWLFYFSGHSDADSVTLTDGTFSAENFVNLFDNDRLRDQLQLVFMSSCKSNIIGEKLKEKGVKVVISSTTSVEPYLANVVSGLFFTHLMRSKSIGEAYETTQREFLFKREKLKFDGRTFKEVEFLWDIFSSSESNLCQPLINFAPNRMQSTLAKVHEISMNVELTNYFNQFGKKNQLQVNSGAWKEELQESQKELEASLQLLKEIGDIDSVTQNDLPDEGHRNINDDTPKLTIKEQITGVIERSQNILQGLKE